MTLDSNTRALLDASARAIVAGRNDRLDLSSLDSIFQWNEDEILPILAERVEHHSRGNKTVRYADKALFKLHGKGQGLYLVLCPVSTPSGMVTELDDSMVLIDFSPYSNGFTVGAIRASRQQIEHYRAFINKHERECRVREQAERAAEAFLGKLTQALKYRVRQCTDAELQAELDKELRFKNALTLEEVAYFATAMDITIDSLV